jgi:hypothetical protein
MAKRGAGGYSHTGKRRAPLRRHRVAAKQGLDIFMIRRLSVAALVVFVISARADAPLDAVKGRMQSFIDSGEIASSHGRRWPRSHSFASLR